MEKPTVGSLFAGIGGLDLGLERAGFQVKWQIEIDDYATKVLEKHWPDVTRFGDVRDCGRHNLKPVDLICGGFPCPVVSQAARGRNTGKWLWPEFARIIHEMYPVWALIENVSGGAWRRWLPIVRRDLHCLGYAHLPLQLRASQFGAPFRGERIYVVAKADCDSESISAIYAQASIVRESSASNWTDWGNAPPRALGVADGVPSRIHRLRGLGNAVVPAVAQWLGERIMESQK